MQTCLPTGRDEEKDAPTGCKTHWWIRRGNDFMDRGLACGRIMAKEGSDGDNGAGTATEEVLQRANAGTDGGVLFS